MTSRNGFTLMEVLVALVILGVMSAGFFGLSARQAERMGYLTEKTIGTLIASNTIAEIQLTNAWPDSGEFTKVVTMAGREWNVTGRVQETESPDIRRLEVSVAPPPANAPTASLVGFVGRH